MAMESEVYEYFWHSSACKVEQATMVSRSVLSNIKAFAERTRSPLPAHSVTDSGTEPPEARQPR
jgi:hypothetical protein